MSKATKRKHVTKEVLEDYYVPENDEEIVKIIRSCGNNLHEVEDANGLKYLVSMPTKFRKNVWVKRGDFVVIIPIEEGNKVKGEIVYILYTKQIKYLKNEKLWPTYFDEVKLEPEKNGADQSKKEVNLKSNNSFDDDNLQSSEEDDESDEDTLFENPNHRPVYYYEEDSSSNSEEESEGSEGNEEDQDTKNHNVKDNKDEQLNDQLNTLQVNEG